MKFDNISWLAKEAGLEMAYPVDHPMAKFIMAITARAASKAKPFIELTPEEMLEEVNSAPSPKSFAMGAAWANAKLMEKNK